MMLGLAVLGFSIITLIIVDRLQKTRISDWAIAIED